MKPHLANALLSAARRETVDELDAQHLFLGLIAIGGGAARMLGEHGVTLGSARALVHGDAVPSTSGDAPSADPFASALLTRFSRLASTHEALAMMIFEAPDVRELLAAGGADASLLIKELGEARDITNPPSRVAVDRNLLPSAALAHAHTHYFPVKLDDVTAALTDPEFLTEWALPERAAGTLDGDVFRHDHGRTTTAVKFNCDHRVTGTSQTVTWVQTMIGGPNDGETLQYDRFELIPGPGGTDVRRSAGHRMFGRFARLLAPVVASIATGYGMSYRAYALSAEIVERSR